MTAEISSLKAKRIMKLEKGKKYQGGTKMFYLGEIYP